MASFSLEFRPQAFFADPRVRLGGHGVKTLGFMSLQWMLSRTTFDLVYDVVP
jgi:hypothetical protein